MKITRRQLRKIIREFKGISPIEIELYLKDVAASARADRLDPASIKMILQDEFMDNFGAYEDIMDYEDMIDDISFGLVETKLHERGTGNPGFAPEERALMDAAMNFHEKYMLAMSMDPSNPADNQRTRRIIDDIIGSVLG
jgi:hypothetical protein